MKRFINILTTIKEHFFTIFFFCVLLTPTIGYAVRGFPKHFSENYFGREKLVYVANNTLYHIFGNQVFPKMIAGDDGWLIYADKDSLNDYQNAFPFTPQEVDSIRSRLNSLCEDLTKQNITFIFFIPPNKNTIYPEYIPTSIPVMNEKSRLDQVVEIYQETKSCRLIDLRQELMVARQKSRVYYATDTHWNSTGELIAYQSLSRILHESFPAIYVHSIEDFTLTSVSYSGDLTNRRFGQIQEYEITLLLRPNDQQKYSILTTTPKKTVTVVRDNTDLPTGLIFCDSFFTSLLPFVAEDFRYAQYLQTTNVDLNLIADTKPDVVILEITERFLEKLLNNPVMQDTELD
jgi:hypothetical protein